MFQRSTRPLAGSLGVMLDPALSWSDHIDHIASKISTRLGMLRKADKIIPPEAYIAPYDSMILPVCDYSCVVWDGCGKTNQDHLNNCEQLVLSKGVKKKMRKNCRQFHTCLQVLKCQQGLAPAHLLN